MNAIDQVRLAAIRERGQEARHQMADQEALDYIGDKLRARLTEMDQRIKALELELEELKQAAMDDSDEPRSLSQIIEDQADARRFLAR